MQTTVYLIRHGETDWNLTGRWQGHADVPLNAVGWRQAQLLGQRLVREGVRFDALYSSDLARAAQTAREVSTALGVAVKLTRGLREIDLGSWSGHTTAELQALYPDDFARVAAGEDIPRGGGESIRAMRQRVVTTIERIIAEHSGATLGVVTHGGCIRALLSHAVSLDGNEFQHFPHIGNTSISVVRIGAGGWNTIVVNDMAHLEATHDPEMISAPPDDAEQPPAL
ncbi:MAG: histidine phosphatase family protein [Chloroflexaceae bacterium]